MCSLSPLLSILCIDWVMTDTTRNRKRGIACTMKEMLEDLDFADDIALLSHRYRDIQDKTNDMARTGKQIGLNIKASETEIIKINTNSTGPVLLDTATKEEVSDFVYLGSKITSDENSEVEVIARIGKAREAFAFLNNIWRSVKISMSTKLRIFKSSVLVVHLYGAESWETTNSIINKLDVFQTRCLRRILRIFWPRTNANANLYKRTNTVPLSQEIKCRRWRWIRHVCRMHPDFIKRVTMRLTPSSKRKRRGLKET